MTGTERTKRPIDPNFEEKVRYARSRTIGERIVDGLKLAELDRELERIRIRAQFPTFSEEQVEQELRYRRAVARQIEEEGIYRDVESDELEKSETDERASD